MRADFRNRFQVGDALEVLRGIPAQTFNTCVTSPPYWGLRDYGHEGQIGLEQTPAEYVARMVDVFREVRRTLRDDGTLWLNLGDSYAGSSMTGGTDPSGLLGYGNGGTRDVRQTHHNHRLRHGLKPKDLVGIPWRVAFALQADGWYLRSDIIWHKPNPMPESVTDRPTKAHEYLFLLSKSERYYYDADAIREPIKPNSGLNMRAQKLGSHRVDGNYKTVTQKNYATIKGANRRSVWTVPTRPYSGAHFACYPPDLIKPCILAGCPRGGIVLDPFFGSGTTGATAEGLGRDWFGIELNPEYVTLIRHRTAQVGLL